MIPGKYNYILLVLLPVLILLAYFRAYQFINILYIVLGAVLLAYNRLLLIYLYLFLLPTNFFLPEVTNIFGFLSGREIVAGFALVAAFTELRFSREDEAFYERDILHGPVRYSWITVLFLILYITLTRIRDVVTDFNPGDAGIGTFNLISYTVKVIVFYLPLFFIIRLTKIDFYRSVFVNAFFYSSVLLSLGVIFSSLLFGTGLIEPNSHIGYYGALTRHAGLFGAGGDINSLAGFLAIAVGFFITQMSLLEINRGMFYGGVALMMLAIVYSGSRTGIICLAIVLFLNLRLRNFLFMILALGLLLLLIPNDIIQTNYDRFIDIGGELNSRGTGSRMYILSRYWENILRQPGVILYGALESFQSGAFHFVPHNFYISLIYRWGIFPVILVISMYFSMAKYIIANHSKSIRLGMLSAFIPFLLVTNTVSDTGYFYAFFMVMALITSEEEIEEYEAG